MATVTLALFEDYIVGSSAVLTAIPLDLAIYGDGGNTIHILGAVTGYTFGLRTMGDTISDPDFHTETFVGAAGYLYGRAAAYSLVGGGDIIVNHGTISGKAAGIATEFGYSGAFHKLENSGLIVSGTGAGPGGINAAVHSKGMAHQATFTDNSGTIKAQLAGSFALLYSGNSHDEVLNTGKIVGKVSLGMGNDSFNTASGTVQGTIDLGAGNDTAYGSAAADTIAGGADHDLIRGNAGADNLDGGAGTADAVDYREKTVAVEVTLNGAAAATVLVNGVAEDTIKNFERVYSGSGADKLYGDSLANVFLAGSGTDLISAGAGVDVLSGGLGNDTLVGGANADSFRFDAALGATNVDTITDFSHADDGIQLENAIFTALSAVPGGLNSNAFLSAASGHTATLPTHRVIYDRSNGQLWYDATGNANGATDARHFATLTTKPATVDHTDFSII